MSTKTVVPVSNLYYFEAKAVIEPNWPVPFAHLKTMFYRAYFLAENNVLCRNSFSTFFNLNVLGLSQNPSNHCMWQKWIYLLEKSKSFTTCEQLLQRKNDIIDTSSTFSCKNETLTEPSESFLSNLELFKWKTSNCGLPISQKLWELIIIYLEM